MRKLRVPSHTTVIAYLALFAALTTGGAYAANQIGSSDIKKNAVKSKHIAKKAVKSSDLAKKAIKTKHIGNKQVKAKNLAADAIGARASATVDGDANFVGPHVGFKSVRSVVTGVYCITLSPGTELDSGKDFAVVTPEWGNSSGSSLVVSWNQAASGCGVGDRDYEVLTFDLDGNASDDVAFTIVVP